MKFRILRSTALVLLLSPVAGCGASTSEVPPVPTIVDAREARDADPCVLLAGDQLTGLGLSPAGAAVPAEEGARCRWRGRGGALEVTVNTAVDGLATLAANSEPTTTRVRLAGYPALETFTGQGEFCQYDVGVAERQVVSAALDAPAPDSCEVLQRVVPQVIEALPQAPTAEPGR